MAVTVKTNSNSNSIWILMSCQPQDSQIQVISKYTFLNSSHICINPLSNQSTKPITLQHKTYIHKHQRQKFRRVSPFNITPVKIAHEARTCCHRRSFRLIYRHQVKEKYKKGMDRYNIKLKNVI